AHTFQCDLPTRQRPALRPPSREPRYGRQHSRERESTSSCCHHLLPGSAKLGARPGGVKRGFELDHYLLRQRHGTHMRLRLCMRLGFTPSLHASAACTRAASITRRRREETSAGATLARPAYAIVAPSAGRAGLLPKPEVSILARR